MNTYKTAFENIFNNWYVEVELTFEVDPAEPPNGNYGGCGAQVYIESAKVLSVTGHILTFERNQLGQILIDRLETEVLTLARQEVDDDRQLRYSLLRVV